MLSRLLLSLVLVCSTALVWAPWDAQAKKASVKSKTKTPKKKRKPEAPVLDQSQTANVVIDGAIVYSGPSFDAPVLTYLREGQKVNVSTKVYGAFYKIELSKTSFGYVSDIDVKVAGQDFTPDGVFGGEPSALANGTDRPLLESVYLGLTGGMLYYTEPLGGQEPLDFMNVIGFKASGPGIVLDGPFVVDFTIKAFTEVPEYYRSISSTLPTGFGVYADTIIVLPLAVWQSASGYYGGGMHFLYTDYNLTRSGVSLFPKELKAGVVGLVGVGFNVSQFAIKAEAKGYYDRSLYWGWEVSLQYAIR